MGMSHHGDGRSERELAELRKRFLGQLDQTARREYPSGRMGAEDDGALCYVMTTDAKHGTIIMRFGKPVEWIGMGIAEAEQLRDNLTERLLELRGITD